MKKILTLALLVVTLQAQAQDSAPTSPKTPIGGRPNIPNDFSIEFGFGQLTNRPADIALNFFGSRSFSVFYQKPFKIFGEQSVLLPTNSLSRTIKTYFAAVPLVLNLLY
jgi:hypothetical protein